MRLGKLLVARELQQRTATALGLSPRPREEGPTQTAVAQVGVDPHCFDCARRRRAVRVHRARWALTISTPILTAAARRT
ncbi:hypothetical protein GCM10011376_24160 [Nocardioides flavus (ex Wang et al. 2016)]|uniref:Uncharacterized protein n=1 Tax=Nocardioides flavus (ex Wang et al. 2016) TaxID=2058780 RepID=A0ABQ3HM61_9ACTN|nr:hypothetical protein GCM10011376_24160 [Nocardioides flavus (ex Wang et al. 2016)]